MSATEELGYEPVPDTGGPAQPLIKVANLRKYFPVKGGPFGRVQAQVQAVDGVSFDVAKGETLGIVGESGCGKSTTAKLLIGLTEKDQGDIIFDGLALGEKLSLKDLRRGVQMVFQDSYATLNPRMTIEASVAFGAQVQGLDAGSSRRIPRWIRRRGDSRRKVRRGRVAPRGRRKVDRRRSARRLPSFLRRNRSALPICRRVLYSCTDGLSATARLRIRTRPSTVRLPRSAGQRQ